MIIFGVHLVACTPYSSNAHNARRVYLDGSLSNSRAYYGRRGVRPDLVEFETE